MDTKLNRVIRDSSSHVVSSLFKSIRVRGEACFPRNGAIRPPAAEREFLGGARAGKSGVKRVLEIQDVSGDMGGMVG